MLYSNPGTVRPQPFTLTYTKYGRRGRIRPKTRSLAQLISSAYVCLKDIFVQMQGSHRLEKYLNIQDCLEKSLKIKFALKSTGKHSKALKSP